MLFRLSFLSLLLLLALQASLSAQRLIAVQNGGTPTFYTELDSAIIHAQAGDSIFLPGGIFPTSSPLIDKTLHIIGVGHHPDSTAATNYTLITGGWIKLIQGADNSSVTGFRGGVAIGTDTTNFEVNDVTIQSIYGGFIANDFFGLDNPSSGLIFRGNIITGIIHGGNIRDGLFVDNIIYQARHFKNGNYFANNVFIQDDISSYSGSPPINHMESCTFENNVFLSSGNVQYQVLNCLFNNNICANSGTGDSKKILSGSQGSLEFGTIYNQDMTALFESLGTNLYSFAYDDDYRLKAGSPGKNYGRDGTDVGVYGGVFAWKLGNIPFNPHVQSVLIDPTTNGNGGLQVKIQVEAQKY